MDVWFHSDGYVNDIVGDLIEIGVDVINVQTAVVGHDWIARNARGRVAFRTDIDRQRILPFGSPAEVKEEVHRTFEACGTPAGRTHRLRRGRARCPARQHPGDVRSLPRVRRYWVRLVSNSEVIVIGRRATRGVEGTAPFPSGSADKANARGASAGPGGPGRKCPPFRSAGQDGGTGLYPETLTLFESLPDCREGREG